MNDVDYIGLDLDGTLLDSNKQISKANVDAIINASNKGYVIIVVSGRHFREISLLLSRFSLFDYVSYVVSCDGIYVYEKSECIKSFPLLSKQDIRKIISFIGSSDFEAYTDARDYFFISSFYRYVVFLAKRIIKGNRLKPIYQKTILLSREYEKVFVPAYSTSLEKLLSIKQHYTVHIKNPNMSIASLEVLNKEVNKYNALKWMSEMGIIDLNRILYFGDDYNDLECFENLKSVVMGNAPESLKKYSVLTARSNDDDGVAQILSNLS